MTVTRDVVLDLLPLYLADEASADSRQLVESFLATDPQLARLARAGAALPLDAHVASAPPADDALARTALARTRRLIGRQKFALAGAIALTLFPFSFEVIDGRLTWLMLRDQPAMAVACGVGALVCWVIHARLRSQLRVAGL